MSRDVLGQAAAARRRALGRRSLPLLRERLDAGEPGARARGRAAGRAWSSSRNLHKSVFAGLVLAGLEPGLGAARHRSRTRACRSRVPAERVREALDRRAGRARRRSSSSRRTSACSRDVGAIAAAAHGARRPARRRPGLGRALRVPSGAAAVDARARRGRDGHVGAQDARRPSRRAPTSSRAASGSTSAGSSEAFEALHTTSPSAAILASLDRARGAHGDSAARSCSGGRSSSPAGARERSAGSRACAILDARRPDEARPRARAERARTGSRSRRTRAPRACASSWRTATRSSRSSRSPTRRRASSAWSSCSRRSLERHRGEPRAARARRASVWAVEPEVAHHPARGVLRAARDRRRGDRATGGSPPRWSPRTRRASRRSPPARSCARRSLDALREAAAEGTRIAYCADPTLETIQVVARS